METIISSGADGLRSVVTRLFNIAMRMERDAYLQAGHYQRTGQRRGYANGTKDKKLDTLAVTLQLKVPKTRDHDAPFYPTALDRGRWTRDMKPSGSMELPRM